MRCGNNAHYNWNRNGCVLWVKVVSATRIRFVRPYPKGVVIDCGRRERRERRRGRLVHLVGSHREVAKARALSG